VDEGAVVAKARKPKKKIKRTDKFFLGLNPVMRALKTAERQAERSIAKGKIRVRQTRNDPAALKANRFALNGSKEAKQIVRTALRKLMSAPCLDEWMNCDPEYFRAAARRPR
jgi:hypothetical protein